MSRAAEKMDEQRADESGPVISAEPFARRLEEGQAVSEALTAGLREVIYGQDETLEHVVTCLLAGGHVLLEGAPGLGKTQIVRTLAALVDGSFARIQFTPDLMPSDVLGTSLVTTGDDGQRDFRYREGPIFANLVLADEINRATPKTQSALLEAMGERTVSVDGVPRPLPRPFFVLATENPIEMEGTYPLPEAQLDRFLFKIELSMPDQETLEKILATTTTGDSSELEPALHRADVLRLQALLREIPASSDMVALVGRLILATHPGNAKAPDRIRSLVRHGASPRGGQALLLASKARALLHGRLHVSADDLRALAAPALRHRLVLSYEGEASGVHPDELVAEALSAIGI